MDHCTDILPRVLRLAFVAAITLSATAHATTEAEAVDELVAVLGATLPCPRYAVAWLDDAVGGIAHRCLASPANAGLLTDQLEDQRVYYSVDMRAARSRFEKVYRSRGTPTPAVVLAEFLQTLAALAESGGGPERHFSPLVVYSRSTTSEAVTPVTVQQRPVTQKAMFFSP